jgi:hypothetical protein
VHVGASSSTTRLNVLLQRGQRHVAPACAPSDAAPIVAQGGTRRNTARTPRRLPAVRRAPRCVSAHRKTCRFSTTSAAHRYSLRASVLPSSATRAAARQRPRARCAAAKLSPPSAVFGGSLSPGLRSTPVMPAAASVPTAAAARPNLLPVPAAGGGAALPPPSEPSLDSEASGNLSSSQRDVYALRPVAPCS